jgi:hypothetical protein
MPAVIGKADGGQVAAPRRVCSRSAPTASTARSAVSIAQQGADARRAPGRLPGPHRRRFPGRAPPGARARAAEGHEVGPPEAGSSRRSDHRPRISHGDVRSSAARRHPELSGTELPRPNCRSRVSRCLGSHAELGSAWPVGSRRREIAPLPRKRRQTRRRWLATTSGEFPSPRRGAFGQGKSSLSLTTTAINLAIVAGLPSQMTLTLTNANVKTIAALTDRQFVVIDNSTTQPTPVWAGTVYIVGWTE